MRSLEQLINENELPIKVRSANGTVARIVSVIPRDNRAIGYLIRSSDGRTYAEDSTVNMKGFQLDREHWGIWSEPKPVEHYRAIVHQPRNVQPDGYALSTVLYHSESLARQNLGTRFIRLATEFEPIMLPLKEM